MDGCDGWMEQKRLIILCMHTLYIHMHKQRERVRGKGRWCILYAVYSGARCIFLARDTMEPLVGGFFAHFPISQSGKSQRERRRGKIFTRSKHYYLPNICWHFSLTVDQRHTYCTVLFFPSQPWFGRTHTQTHNMRVCLRRRRTCKYACEKSLSSNVLSKKRNQFFIYFTPVCYCYAGTLLTL